MKPARVIKFFLTFLLLQAMVVIATAQQKDFARKQIDTLTSPFFGGRGYVHSGDTRAAVYISDKFRELGLKPFGSSYLQQFKLPVNTFPDEMQVKADKKELRPGYDFLVNPSSDGTVGSRKFKLKYIDSVYLSKKLEPLKKNSAIVIDKKLLNKGDSIWQKIAILKPAAIVELTNKGLIWSVGKEPYNIVWLEATKNAFPKAGKKIKVKIDQLFLPDYQSQNVIGYVEGSKYPDSFIVISAHYDHLGRMGKATYFPGANDNASGTAMMIDLARHYRQPENRPKYSIAFIAFGAEEAGLVGSKYFTENPLFPLKNIAFVLNMDLMATGQDGMMVVNGSVFPEYYDRLVSINSQHNYLKEIKQRGKAANSDHYWFSEKGVKSFFFYLLGDYPHYHDPQDTKEKPTLAGYEGAFRLIRDYIENLQSKP